MNLTNECCIRLTPIGFDADYLSEGISTTADDRATPSEMPDSAAISYAVGATNTTASTVVTDTDAHLTASAAQTTAAPLSPQTSAMLSATPTGSYASHTLLGQAEVQNHYHTHDALVDKESDVTGMHLCSPLAYTPSVLTNGAITANTPAKSTNGTYTANGNTSSSGANNYTYNIPSPQTLYQSHFGGASVLPTAVSSTNTVNNNNTLSKANSTHTLTAATTVGSPFFASVTSANKSAWPSAMSRSVSTASLSDTTNNHQHHHLGPTSATSYGVTTAMQSASNAPGSMTTLPTPVFTPTNNVVSSFATPTTTTTTMTAMFTQSPNATTSNNTTIVGVPQGLGSTAHVPMPPSLVTPVPTLASAGMPKFSSNPFAAVAGSGAGLSSLHPKSPSPPCAPLGIGATNTTGTKGNTDAHTNNTSNMPVSQPHALSPSPPPPPPPLPQPPTPLTGTVSPAHNEANTTATTNDTNTTTTTARSCPVTSGTGWTSLTPTPPPPPPPTIGSTAVNETNGHTLQPGNYLAARRASDASLLYSPIRPVDNYVSNRSTAMQEGTYGPQGGSFGRGGLACASSHSRLTSPNSSREASFYGSSGSFALPEPTTTTANGNGVASSSAMHAGFAQAESGGNNNNREGLRVPGPRNTNTTTAASGWSYVIQGSNGTNEGALPANSPPPLLRRFATQPATTAQDSTPHAEGTRKINTNGNKQQEDDDDEDYTALYSPFTDNVFSTTIADDDEDEAALPPPPPLPAPKQEHNNNDEATHMGLPHTHSLPSSSPHYNDPQGLLASQPADSSCAELDELTAMPSVQSIGHDESPVTRTETRSGETLVPVYDPDFKDLLAIPTSQIFHRPHPCFGVSRLVLCRNFVLEKGAESCGKGARCKFVHADTTNVTRSSIHVNYAWRSLELCTYARLPSGDMLRVLAPNERQPSEWIPSERVLVTRGSVNWRQHSSPLSHCAHYYFNRMCNRGERCNFIHAVYVDPNVQGDFKRAPAPVAVASAGMVKHGHSNNNNGSSTRSVSSTTSMHEGHASLHNGGPFMVSAGTSAMTTPRMGPDMLRPNPQTQQPQLFSPVPAMTMMMMPAPVSSAALLTPQGSRAHNASGAGVEGPEAQMMIRSTLSSPLVPPIQSPTASLTPFGTPATGAALLQGAMMTTSHAIPICASNHTTSAGHTLSPGALLSPMGHMHAALSMPPSPNFLPQQQQQRLSGNYAEMGLQPRSAPSGPFTMMVMSPLSASPLQAQTPRSTSPMLGQGNTTAAAAGPFAARSSSENNTVPNNNVTNNHFMQSYRAEAADARLSPFSPPAAPTSMNSRNTTPPQATHITAQPAQPLPFEPTLSELSRDYDGLLFSPHTHNSNSNNNGHGIKGKDVVASGVTNGTAAMAAKVAGSSDTVTAKELQDFGSIGPTPQDHANTTTSTTITSATMTGSQAKSSGMTVPTALYSDAIWSDLPDTFATQEENEDVIGLESLLDLSEDKKCIES